MSIRRLKAAEWAVLLGAVGLLGSMFADWFALGNANGVGWTVYARGAHSSTGWATLGWFTDLLIGLTLIAAFALVAALVVSGRDVANTPPGVVLVTIGIPMLIVLFVVALTRPDLGIGAPNDAVSIEPAGWIGMGSAVLLVAGALASLRDERTTGFGRRVPPPEPRPAPPVGR